MGSFSRGIVPAAFRPIELKSLYESFGLEWLRRTNNSKAASDSCRYINYCSASRVPSAAVAERLTGKCSGAVVKLRHADTWIQVKECPPIRLYKFWTSRLPVSALA